MGTKKKQTDLLGDIIEKGKEGAKKTKDSLDKKVTRHTKADAQQDFFPETIPTTAEGKKALSAAQKKKLKESQMDMFPKELKNAKQKVVKKAAGGPIQKFGVGGCIGKQLKKGAGKAAEATGKAAVAAGKATGKTATRFTKAAAATATKKAKDLIAKKKKKIADKKKTQTKVLQQQTNWSKSQAGQARNWDDLPAKTKEVMEKHKLAGGGFLKKAKGAWETSKDKAAGKKAAKARHDKLEEKGTLFPEVASCSPPSSFNLILEPNISICSSMFSPPCANIFCIPMSMPPFSIINSDLFDL